VADVNNTNLLHVPVIGFHCVLNGDNIVTLIEYSTDEQRSVITISVLRL
jgi:hypothetical protein